jgi:WD40 repeat protein
VAALAFAPDGKTLATGSWDTTIRLWDVARGRSKAVLSGHKGILVSVVFSADGRMLASSRASYLGASDDGSKRGSEVKVWEVATGQERLTFFPEKGWSEFSYLLQFTGNGKYLMTVGCAGGAFKKWDLARLAVNPK